MTLLDSWETLVVSLSNNPNLTFEGVRSSIFNEKIRRKAKMYRGTLAKAKACITCYQCGRKDHKKHDCVYYKAELERKRKVTRRKMIVRMKHITTLRTRTKRRPMWPLTSSLRSHQMQKILFVLPWKQIMLMLMVLLFLFMHMICRLERALFQNSLFAW